MSGVDPVLDAWARVDRATPGWERAKKGIDAYQKGDVIEAIWRVQAVRWAWGNDWAFLTETLWSLHPNEGKPRPFPKPDGKLRRGLRRVGRWLDPIWRVAKGVGWLIELVDVLFILLTVLLFAIWAAVSLFYFVWDLRP